MAGRADIERLARRAAGGDLAAAKRLLAELVVRSAPSDEDERGLYAVIRESHSEGVEQETLSLHLDRRSALMNAAHLAANELRRIREDRQIPSAQEPPEFSAFFKALESGDAGAALHYWNSMLNVALSSRDRVWFWVEGPIPLKP